MIIRKLFKFEGAHVVRNCHSERCKFSIHGHSYKVEVFFTSDHLDNAQMVLDFGVLKNQIKDFLDSFDHCWAYWNKESEEFKDFVHNHSARWVELPVNISAEALAVFFYSVISALYSNMELNNGEQADLLSVRVHETETGYAEATGEDTYCLNQYLKGYEGATTGMRAVNSIIFSDQVKAEWHDPLMWEKLIRQEKFIYSKPIQQI
jgi:6-pyruvoyltetrahydropterin/6-carboxytetrahydropterin synthase